MPPLTKRTAPLLRTVQNRQHATDEDHDGTPQVSSRSQGLPKNAKVIDEDEDITRPPESSDDDDDQEPAEPAYTVPKGTKRIPPPGRVRNIHVVAGKSGAKSKRPVTFKQPSALSEEKRRLELDAGDSDDDKVLFSSQGSNKRLKHTFGKKAQANNTQVSFRPPPQTGKENTTAQHVLPKFKLPPTAPAKARKADALPSLRSPFSRAEDVVPTSTDSSAATKGLASPGSPTHSTSSSLTSLSSSPLRSPARSIDDNETSKPCRLCGAPVDLTFWHDFAARDDPSTTSTSLTSWPFKKQSRFCAAHQARHAQITWRDRGYPTIDWATLDTRMRRHESRICDVLGGKVRSRYREDVEDRLRSGATRTVRAGLDAGAHTAARTGYYGSRGEKAMREFLLRHFSARLRRLASGDSVMAHMGVSGGVSGYVQAVLVPEMALALVREDLGCGEEEAARVVGESSEVGEAVNEEEADRIGRSEVG